MARTVIAWFLLGACSGSGAVDVTGEPTCVNKCDGNVSSFALPDTLDLGRDPSSLAVRDLDGDGYLDVAALVKDPARDGSSTVAALVVAYGAAQQPWSQRTTIMLTGSVQRESRDSSSSVVAIADIDDDGTLDIATASGVARGGAGRNLTWTSFGADARDAFQPVGILRRGATTYVLRGTFNGHVERCTPAGDCTALPGQNPTCADDVYCAIEDLAIADFTGDSVLDVIAGRPSDVADDPDSALLWDLANGWQSPQVLPNISAVDFEVGDIDRDGRADLVAQVRETISDFPTNTAVWFATGSSPPFVLAQTLYNNDNHTDNAGLADANGDDCLDLMMIGVDSSATAVRLGLPAGGGCARHLGPHDPTRSTDVGWTTIPAFASMVGIQQLDLNGDGVDDWAFRVHSTVEQVIKLTPVDITP